MLKKEHMNLIEYKNSSAEKGDKTDKLKANFMNKSY